MQLVDFRIKSLKTIISGNTVRSFVHTSFSLLVLFAVMAGGCTGSKSTTTPASSTTADNVLRELRKAYQSTPNLSIEGEMKISGVPATVWFDALIKRTDSMKVLLTLPFGLPGGGMSATPEHFVFYQAQEGVAVEGRPDRETFAKLMQVGLNYDELMALLRGEVPKLPEPGGYTATERDGFIIYYVTTGSIVEEIMVDPTLPVVKTYIRKRIDPNAADSTSGRVTELGINYDNFKVLGSRRFAYRAMVNIRDGEQTINVKITKASEKLPDGESLALDVPQGIERRRL
jgi:hypothetical protein